MKQHLVKQHGDISSIVRIHHSNWMKTIILNHLQENTTEYRLTSKNMQCYGYSILMVSNGQNI